MIRVLWNVPNTSSWVGGLNYFVNLYNGIMSIPDRRVEPVILGSAAALPPPLNSCIDLQLPHNHSHRRYSIRWIMAKLRERILRQYGFGQSDPMLQKYLYEYGIRLFSHGWSLGENSAVPCLCWIPDFQHRHLPQFFSPEEITARNNDQRFVAETAQGLLFSSEDARSDFNRFYPGHQHKTYVLHFVASVNSGFLPAAEEVLKRYEINEPFFHVPNQLWQHKNHGVIIDALKILDSSGKCPLIISTGQTNDYRNPHYFGELKAKVDRAGLRERFRFLGLIDLADVQVLMRESICMINPSFFEGWSTTVEEAKSLGKRLLLSDINVHREQAPERGKYFSPNNPEALADGIREMLESYNPVTEAKAVEAAEADFPGRLRTFGQAYEDIVISMLRENEKKE